MGLQLIKAGTSDALTLNGISKRSFDSDVLVEGLQTAFYTKLGYKEIKRDRGLVYYSKEHYEA